MQSTFILSLLSLSGVLALPGPRQPLHHHHVKRDEVVVYATVQVTEYVTMTAGQGNVASSQQSVTSLATSAETYAGNVALAIAAVSSPQATAAVSLVPVQTTLATSRAQVVTSSSSTSAATATPSASSTTNTVSGAKRGIAWPSANPSSYNSLFSNTIASWYFNWGTTATSGLSGMTFIYQQWGSDNIDNLAKIPTGSTVLGFNEPDGTGQASMSAAAAAALYQSNFTPLRKTGQIAYLGTPSITNGASGITWLTEFMSLCSDCEIDFVSAHWYGPTIDLLESQMTTLHTTFSKPVWITEMACTEWVAASNPSSSAIASFMSSAMSWMESQSWIEKYAWFGALQITDTALGAGNMLITSDGTALSALGKEYLSS